MSVLKIKDSQGNWVGVPSIKGDKGDTGATGPQGPQGDSYVLTAQDKADIADLVLAELPTAETEGF